MRNELVTFAFEGQDVRFVGTSDVPAWVAVDVCAALGLANPYSSLALLPEDEKGLHAMETLGGPQKVVTVNEPGLFRLILTSRRPEAERLKRWLCHEVLPAIRRTGAYGTAPALAGIEARLAALEAKAEAKSAPKAVQSPRVYTSPPADRRFSSFRDPHFDPDSVPVPELRCRVHPHAAPHLRELLCALRDTVGAEGVAISDGFARAPRLAVAFQAFGSSAARVGQALSRFRGFRHEGLVLDYGRAKRAMATFDAPARRTTATWRARVVPVEAKPVVAVPRDRWLFGDGPTAAELDRAAGN